MAPGNDPGTETGPEAPEPVTESVARSASLVSVATLCSRVLGLVREAVFAALFAAGAVADAFTFAFRIPNLLRDFFAEGALASAFVPTLADAREKGGGCAGVRAGPSRGGHLGRSDGAGRAAGHPLRASARGTHRSGCARVVSSPDDHAHADHVPVPVPRRAGECGHGRAQHLRALLPAPPSRLRSSTSSRFSVA